MQPGIETVYVLRSYDYQTPRVPPAQPDATAPLAAMGGQASDAAIVLAGAAGQAQSAPALPNEGELQGVLGATGQVSAVPRKPIYIEGQWVEVPATSSAPGVTTGPSTEAAGMATGAASAEVDWAAAITEGSRQRILRIPVRDLMRGDPRFNVVIRPNDKVYAWIGPVGEFYVNGNVYRPGVFSLTGRKITVRQAIVAAGGLSQLAIPERCELVRRYNDSQEEIIRLNLDAIFAGSQPERRAQAERHDQRGHERGGAVHGDDSQRLPADVRVRVCVRPELRRHRLVRRQAEPPDHQAGEAGKPVRSVVPLIADRSARGGPGILQMGSP